MTKLILILLLSFLQKFIEFLDFPFEFSVLICKVIDDWLLFRSHPDDFLFVMSFHIVVATRFQVIEMLR